LNNEGQARRLTKQSKLFVAWVFIFMFGLAIQGCKDEGIVNDAVAPDEYYVKYELTSTGVQGGRKLDLTLRDENSATLNITIDQKTNWETIIGPVSKGFSASLKAVSTSETNYNLRLYSKIQVSKNGSPFALKAIDGSDTPRGSVELSYKIDY
jgi:hypothetical protein